jgi:hypothetical protein
MSCDGIKVTDIWGAAALGYAGYEVSRIEILGERAAEVYFNAPSLDAQIILDDYQNNRLVLTDAKAYSLAFTSISKHISALRRKGETSWAAPENRDAWYAASREKLAAKQASRK